VKGEFCHRNLNLVRLYTLPPLPEAPMNQNFTQEEDKSGVAESRERMRDSPSKPLRNAPTQLLWLVCDRCGSKHGFRTGGGRDSSGNSPASDPSPSPTQTLRPAFTPLKTVSKMLKSSKSASVRWVRMEIFWCSYQRHGCHREDRDEVGGTLRLA
jgi:hypothetical protein